jgi:hypothetical protein
MFVATLFYKATNKSLKVIYIFFATNLYVHFGNVKELTKNYNAFGLAEYYLKK